jgi:hypothetical protein
MIDFSFDLSIASLQHWIFLIRVNKYYPIRNDQE